MVGVGGVKEEELERERVTHLFSPITDQMTKKDQYPLSERYSAEITPTKPLLGSAA